ncbi:TetR family transcriptional regulator [Devosia alba]|uniref:TetR family transcriptional regulator n=1 Tax=Devosia alba TaxID=3152360 RepID=UPI003267F835
MQKQIADAAHALFIERGFEGTTIGDVAAAVGMSQRSVFRYFATKEDLIIGKFDFAAASMLATLRDRPAGEVLWVSLRRAFDEMVIPCDDPRQRPAAVSILKVVFGTPALFAAYLQKMQEFQGAVVEALIERAIAAGHPYAKTDPAPRALTAAAFGCLVAAQHSWLAGGTAANFAACLDSAMAAVRPTISAPPPRQ